MKKILFVALALIVGLASCVKDEKYPGINITGVTYLPTEVTSNDSVTVKAVITSFEAFTATLYYVVGDETSTLDMIPTNEKDTYAAIIPAMPIGTNVTFYVKANNNKTEAVSVGKNYTVGAVVFDYSVLRLNELNGNDKFIEIYNAGAEAINLADCYIEKDAEQNWLGTADITIEAGAYLLLYSKDVMADHPEFSENCIFHSGLSAKKNVRIQLFTPAGVSIDDFNLVNIDLNGEAYGYAGNQAPASYSRNADGKWYYAGATPGAANVDGTNIVLGLEDGNPQN